jgi:hypothetical protein
MLRSRSLRGEESLGVHLPDPLVSPDAELQPEEEALLAESAGLALLAVLDTLAPAERLAFVLHDMFELSPSAAAPGLPFTASIGETGGLRAGSVPQLAQSPVAIGPARRPSPDPGPVSRVRVWVTAVPAGS